MSLTLDSLARATLRIRAEIWVAASALTDVELDRHRGLTLSTAREWRQSKSAADRSHRSEKLHCRGRPTNKAAAMEICRALWLPLNGLLVMREAALVGTLHS